MLDIQGAELRDGKLMLTVPVWQSVKWLEDFRPGEYDVEPHKAKRSLNANSYCWKLCGDISEALRDGSSPEKVYRRAVTAVGIYKDFRDIRPEDATTLKAAWERLGLGWIAKELDYEPDGDHVVIRCWYGSSVYNTKQMSRLIDFLVQDARAMGLETLDDQRMGTLLKEWNDGKK